MHQRDVRARAMQLQRRLRRRIAPADDDDALAVVRMRLAVIVAHVRQILARHAQEHRMIVVADRQSDMASEPDAADAERRARLEREQRPFRLVVGLARNRQHLLFERDLQVEDVDDLAVIAERLGARRLVVRRHERQAADLEQLRRGEEHHLRREVVNRVHERALLDHLVIEAVLLGGDGGRQAGRAGADDEEVADRHDLHDTCPPRPSCPSCPSSASPALRRTLRRHDHGPSYHEVGGRP